MMMRILLVVLVVAGVFRLMEPPESLQSPDTVPQAQALMMPVPSCYGGGLLVLGEARSAMHLEEVPGLQEQELESGLLQLEWKEHDAFAGVDTLVRCTFERDRLVAVEAVAILNQAAASKEALLAQNLPGMPCLSEVAPALTYGRNLRYAEKQSGVSQEFELITDDDRYLGIRYRMSYEWIADRV